MPKREAIFFLSNPITTSSPTTRVGVAQRPILFLRVSSAWESLSTKCSSKEMSWCERNSFTALQEAQVVDEKTVTVPGSFILLPFDIVVCPMIGRGCFHQKFQATRTEKSPEARRQPCLDVVFFSNGQVLPARIPGGNRRGFYRSSSR